jgi:D-alanine-D-alanine ligase-like ATP-grasp enzyme
MRNIRRAVVIGADLTRTVGPRNVSRIVAQDRRRRAQGEGPRDSVYERLWRDAAEAAGARVDPLGGGFLDLSRGDARTRVQHQHVQLDDPVAYHVARDKRLSLALLSAAGVAVPPHVEVAADDLRSAQRFAADAGTVVAKPAGGTGGGFGVTAQLRSDHDLRRAMRRGARTQSRMVLEQQVEGTVHRLLLLDGVVLDVVRRHPPRVVGDGHSTIFELMLAENERRLAGYGAAGIDLLRVDLDCLTTLRARGARLNQVPARDAVTVVKTVNNQNRAADNETLPARELCDSLIRECVDAARVLGLRLAGVDVITTDPSRPLRDVGGAIIEVNPGPGLHHHHHVADPRSATAVAVPVLECLLAA